MKNNDNNKINPCDNISRWSKIETNGRYEWMHVRVVRCADAGHPKNWKILIYDRSINKRNVCWFWCSSKHGQAAHQRYMRRHYYYLFMAGWLAGWHIEDKARHSFDVRLVDWSCVWLFSSHQFFPFIYLFWWVAYRSVVNWMKWIIIMIRLVVELIYLQTADKILEFWVISFFHYFDCSKDIASCNNVDNCCSMLVNVKNAFQK